MSGAEKAWGVFGCHTMEMEDVFLQIQTNVQLVDAQYAVWQQRLGVNIVQPQDIGDLLRYLGNSENPAQKSTGAS
jgi:hypothetical protein